MTMLNDWIKDLDNMDATWTLDDEEFVNTDNLEDYELVNNIDDILDD